MWRQRECDQGRPGDADDGVDPLPDTALIARLAYRGLDPNGPKVTHVGFIFDLDDHISLHENLGNP